MRNNCAKNEKYAALSIVYFKFAKSHPKFLSKKDKVKGDINLGY